MVFGQLYQLASRLAANREDYKAADSLMRLAKVQAWMGAKPDSLWTTFSKPSQADLDEINRPLRDQIEQQKQQSHPVIEPLPESKQAN